MKQAHFLYITLVLMLLTQTVGAQVTSQVPPGPNEQNWKFCGSAGQIFFEGLPEGSVLGEVIPGVKFTTTAGQNWLVGTWSSNKYNGKFPRGSYTSEGDAWAWLGPNQGAGIIAFTNGLASYFSLFTSTIGGVTVDAFDQNGVKVANSGFATNNINTGTMDKLTISRPTADIASVQVHDSGNYWLIDSVCTDAPGVACKILKVPNYKQYNCQASSISGCPECVCGSWYSDIYDSTSLTIGAYGCGVTSMIDLLRSYGFTTTPDGRDLNPGNLNDWMNTNHRYSSNSTFWHVVDDISGGKLQYDNVNSLGCDTTNSTTCASLSYTPGVDDDIFNQRPAILQVPWKKFDSSGNVISDEIGGHYVVANGKCTATYNIADPGRTFAYNLSATQPTSHIPYYDNIFNGYRRYMVQSDSVIRPILVLNIHSPADILVTTSDGKRAGLDPTTGQRYAEIPGSSYTDEGGISAEDGSGPRTPAYRSLEISNAGAGAYKVQLIGNANGSYLMDLISRDISGIYATQEIRGNITNGADQQFNLQYSPVQAEAASIFSPGSLIGGGNISGAAVAANVTATASAATGTVMVNLTAPGRQLIQSTSIRSAAFQPGAANINGNCTVNGQSGYTFSLTLIRTTTTQVSATVQDGKGNIVYNISGSLNGNLNITAY